MGRRQSKYLFYLCVILLGAYPLYCLLDTSTTGVIPTPRPPGGAKEELLHLPRRQPGGDDDDEEEGKKKTFENAPTVIRPRFVPYPTKAKPGAPWRDFEKFLSKNTTKTNATAALVGDVVIQEKNLTLIHKTLSSSAPRKEINLTPGHKEVFNNEGRSENIRVQVRNAPGKVTNPTHRPVLVNKTIIDVKDTSQREQSDHEHHGVFLGGMLIATDPPSLKPEHVKDTAARVPLAEHKPPKSDVHETVAAVKSTTTTPDEGEVEDWKALLDYQNKIPPPRAFDDVSTPVKKSHQYLGSYKNDTKQNGGNLPQVAAGKLKPGEAPITKSNQSSPEDRHAWKRYFDNPAEVHENNANVRVDMDSGIVGRQHVYPTKARPAAPMGVDFYRKKGQDGPPLAANIVGGEPKQAETPKPTDPYAVFGEEAKLQAWDAGARRTYDKLEGENIVSMTLYGSDPRYTMGAIRNAEMVSANFPGWKLRIYTETPAESSRYGAVPNTVLVSLRNLGAELYFMQPGEDFIPPMMWRFLVADDMWVSRFIVRDADARLTERDAAAVHEWVRSGAAFNCIRDHPSHAAYAVSGGMWGGKPQVIRNTLRRSWRELMKGVRSDYLQDMNFLNLVVWPKISAQAYCSDSVSCDQWTGAHPFPVPRYGYEHVGQVFNEHDLGRPIDIQLLRSAGENKKCSPKDDPRDLANSAA